LIINHLLRPGSSEVEREELEIASCKMLLAFSKFDGQHYVLNDFKYLPIETLDDLDLVVNSLRMKIGHQMSFRAYYNNIGKLSFIAFTNAREFFPEGMAGWKYVQVTEDIVGETLH
tara:strand:+ start:320 stop:667 length:348 start_codon:yes stop_codon:yes gene_type:complete